MNTHKYDILLRNEALLSFLITFLLFSISYITVGWWTDAYQHMYDTAISGELTDYYLPAGHNPFPEYMPGAAYILNRLGELYPIRWVAFFLNGILFISIWILFRQILRYSDKFPLFSKVILLAFFSLLFFESIVLYHMVRITMFAGIAAMSFLIVTKEDKIFSTKSLPYLLLFVVALWIRCNVHLFVLVFVTGVFILHKRSLKPLIPFWVAFILFFLFYCNIVFWTDHTNDLNSYFLYNTEFKLYHVGAYTPNLQFTEPNDSLKYAAIKYDIMADEQNLNIAFYERVNMFSGLNKMGVSQFKHACFNFVNAIGENIYFILADFVLIVFYIFLGGAKLNHYRIKTILIFVFFYLITFSICFIKMENRFLVPFQVLFLFVIIVLHQPKVFVEGNHKLLLILFVVLVFPLSSVYIYKKIDTIKQQTANFKNSFEWLRQNHADKTLVYNTGFVTKNRPYETFYQKKYFSKFYIYNFFSTQLSPGYRPYLEKECSCNVGHFYPFYEYLRASTPRAIILDDPKRIAVLEQYLDKVNRHPQHFKQLESQVELFTLVGGRNLHLFEIR